MRINNNISALNAWRNLTFTDTAMGKNLEKLSSGLRINRAADDAAGLAISEQMRGQIRGLNQAVRNAQDGISLIQTAEGALTESHAILQRMRELAVQAANDTYTAEDRQKLQHEVDDLILELNRIAETTEFNSKKLLDGSFGQSLQADAAAPAWITNIEAKNPTYLRDHSIEVENNAGVLTVTVSTLDDDGVTQSVAHELSAPEPGSPVTLDFAGLGIKLTIDDNITDTGGAAVGLLVASGTGGQLHVGANAGTDQEISIQIGSMTAQVLGVDAIDISTSQTDASTAIQTINDALTQVSEQRAQLGAKQNRLEHTIANLSVAAENLTAAESRIRDVDMAQEMTKFTRNQILLQAGTAMLAQANMAPQSVLQLLR